MNRSVRIGVQIQPQHADYGESRRAVAAAEEAGITLFTIGLSGPSYNLRLVREWIAWRDEQNAR